MNTVTQMRAVNAAKANPNALTLHWLGPVRMLVIAIIAFGYASTMPRGPSEAEYFRFFGHDPSWLGIAIVFMISGFLALKSLHRHGSPARFLRSRLMRNLPILVLFSLLVILVAFPLLGVPLNGTTGDGSRLAQHLKYLFKVITCLNANELTPGLLDNALYMCVIQGGLWTFRWGVIAYIFTGALWTLGGLRSNRTLFIFTGAAITSYAALMVYGTKTPDPHPVLELATVGLRLGWVYLAGMCAFGLREKLPRTLWVPIALMAVAGIQYYILPWTPFIEISMELSLGYLVFLGVTSKKQMPDWMKNIPDISLGLYVFNWPATQITLLLIPSLTPWPLFALSFPVTILVALASWALISRRLNLNLAKPVALQI